MEHWKKKLGAICLMLFLLVPGTATAVVIPKDLPTIEALIALHKCIKKDEDQALGRVATSFGEQSLVSFFHTNRSSFSSLIRRFFVGHPCVNFSGI